MHIMGISEYITYPVLIGDVIVYPSTWKEHRPVSEKNRTVIS